MSPYAKEFVPSKLSGGKNQEYYKNKYLNYKLKYLLLNRKN